MYFFAHVVEYDGYDNKENERHIIINADNFTDAAKVIEKEFRNALVRITFLEPFTDNNVIYIDAKTEEAIKDNEYNCF